MPQPGDRTPISAVMQHLDLSDDEAGALAQELHAIVENDRYPLSRPYHGPPMTLGTAAGVRAEARLIVWWLDCRHQVEPLTGRSGLSAIIR